MQKQQINKLKGLIGIANKAGYVIFGVDNLKNYNKKLYLVVKAMNCGNGINKFVENLQRNENKNIEFVEMDNQILQQVTMSDNCKIFGVKNKGLTEEIIKILRSENIG